MSRSLDSIVPSGADAVSGSLTLARNYIMGIQARWPSTLQGTLKVQVCIDDGRWEDIPNSSVSLTGTASGQVWNYERCGFSFARLYFTYSSGSGTITVVADAKGSS